MNQVRAFATAILLGLPFGAASAADGKVLATSGLMAVEGGAGGGLATWAVIGGYAVEEQWGVAATAHYAVLDDYDLSSAGLLLGVGNRFELSYLRQRFGLDGLRARGLAVPSALEQDVFGAKLRLAGDLIYGRWPQVSFGAQWKRHRDGDFVQALGADDERAVEPYLAVSRLILDGPAHRNLLLNATLRGVRGHQFGLLGYDDGRRWQFEGSAALFLAPEWAIGAEYRQKPDRLRFAREDDAWDLFLAWFPNPRLHFALAYLDLGSIAGLRDQRGLYFSVQLTPP